MASDAVIDTIIAEAAGEGRDGMIAVAWAIANRAEVRGQTLDQVVTAPNQFDGYSRPGAKAAEAQKDPALRAEVARIVDGVVTGRIPDPTGGADHYATKSTTTNWTKAYDKTATVGNHAFYASPRAKDTLATRAIDDALRGGPVPATMSAALAQSRQANNIPGLMTDPNWNGRDAFAPYPAALPASMTADRLPPVPAPMPASIAADRMPPTPATMGWETAVTRAGYPPLPAPAPLVAPRMDAVTPMPAFSEMQAFNARPTVPMPPPAPMQNPVAEREAMWSLMDQMQAAEAQRVGDQTVTRADPWSVPGAIAIADPANPPSLGGGAVSSGMLNDWITQQTLQAADTVYREPGGDMPMAAADPWSIPGLMDVPGLSNSVPTPMDLAASRGGVTGEGLNVRSVNTVPINPATGLPMVAKAEVPASRPTSSIPPAYNSLTSAERYAISAIPAPTPSMFHTGGTVTVRPDGSSSFAPPMAGSVVGPPGRPASVPSPAELQAAVPAPRSSWVPSAAVGRAALPPSALSTPLVREVKGPPLPAPLPNQPNGTIVAKSNVRLEAVPKPAAGYKPNTPYNQLTPQQKLEIMKVAPVAKPVPPLPVVRPQRVPVPVQRAPVARPLPRVVMPMPVARPAFNAIPRGQEWMRGISSAPSQTFEGAFPGALI